MYKTFGSKIGLLKEVLDITIGGDDAPLPLLERAGPQAMREETDQRMQVRMLAAGVAGQLERIRPLDDYCAARPRSTGRRPLRARTSTCVNAEQRCERSWAGSLRMARCETASLQTEPHKWCGPSPRRRYIC